jgi:hypothetical protein
VGRRAYLIACVAALLAGCAPVPVSRGAPAPRVACADSVLGRMRAAPTDSVRTAVLIAHVERLDACLRQTAAQLQQTSGEARFSFTYVVIALSLGVGVLVASKTLHP